MRGQPVVVTGMGLATGLGLGVQPTWAGVVQGRSAWGPLTSLEGAEPGACFGGQIPRRDHDDDSAREVEYLRFAIAEALDQAGDRLAYPVRRRGCILGTTLHGMRHAGRWLRGQPASALTGFLASAVLREALAGTAIGGPMLTTCAACSSGLASVALAVSLLESGELDLVIAGGYDTLSEYAYAGFDSLRLVAPAQVRPFCTDRHGMNIAEGYAVLVLERAPDAAARGAAPLAHIRAVAETSDCHHLTQPHPEGHGAQRALRAALDRAGADKVDLISAHATGTPNNDAAERAALAAVFGDQLRSIPVVAFKSNIGHALGGAGAAELILSISALREGLVPPTPGVEPGSVEFPDIALNTGPARPAPIQTVASLSLGFGGANSCAIISRPPAPSARPVNSAPRPSRDVLITGIGVISPRAIGNAAVAALLARLPEPASEPRSVDESQIAHLLSTRRVRRMSNYVKLTLAAAAVALEDAAVRDIPEFARTCAAILGTTHGAAAYSLEYYSQIVAQGLHGANPLLFAEGVPNAGAAQLSLMLQIKGPCQTVIGSRTSGLDALGLAALRIARGEWDRVIVSAAEEHCEAVDESYRAHGLIAEPGAATAFGDAGFRPCAGAVAIVLESPESARARNARARARVSAWSWASGTGARGLIDAVAHTVRAVGAPPIIFSSANGTWLGRAELRGIAAAGRAAVASPMDHLGETFSAGPLAALGGLLLTGGPPPSPGGGRLPRRLTTAGAGARPDRVALVSSDWTGTATAVSVEPRKPSSGSIY